MNATTRHERQQRTIDTVDTFLELEGLQTYTQRGTLIAELMQSNTDDNEQRAELAAAVSDLLQHLPIPKQDNKDYASAFARVSALVFPKTTTTTKEKAQ